MRRGESRSSTSSVGGHHHHPQSSPTPIHKSNSCPPDFSATANGGKLLTPPISNVSSRSRGVLASPPSNGNNAKNGIGVPMGDSSHQSSSSNNRAVPGRPRRRFNVGAPKQPKRKKTNPRSFKERLWSNSRRFRRIIKNPLADLSTYASLAVAILLWYTLGVVSITTSNLLMMAPQPSNHSYVGGVPPLYLTLQQLMIGTTLLRCLIRLRFLGSAGIQPWPSASAAAAHAEQNRRFNLLFKRQTMEPKNQWISVMISSNLVLAGIFFAMGFLATNAGFLASSAAFVETIKAAEPITSASIAVLWGIETLGAPEVFSLAAIVMGVLISTLAHTHAKASHDEVGSVTATLIQTLQSCCIVMASNLCFSFRGLYQKLFRATPEGMSQVVDDLNLQFRMQQIGVVMLVVPVLIFNVPGMIASVWELSSEVGLIQSGILIRYMALAVVNGVAFTSYNLASTFILSRISVVHHAALNCIRRIFAIIMTSLFFGIPITIMGVFGFCVSFGGFMTFTHYKVQKQRQPKPLSSLLPVSAANGERTE